MSNTIIHHSYKNQPDLFIGHYNLKKEKFDAHVHEGFEIRVIISGKGILHYGVKDYIINPGDIYFIDCTTPHAHLPLNNAHIENLYVHIKYNTIESLAPRDKYIDLLKPFFIAKNSNIIPLIHNSNIIREYLLEAEKLYSSKDNFGYFTSWSYIINAIIEINRELTLLPKFPFKKTHFDEKKHLFDMIIDYIHKNYNKEITLTQLSSNFGISNSSLSKLFKEYIKCSPIKYRNKVRINKSIILLKTTSNSVEKIACDCGFNDTANYRRIFKYQTCKVPNSYRNVE